MHGAQTIGFGTKPDLQKQHDLALHNTRVKSIARKWCLMGREEARVLYMKPTCPSPGPDNWRRRVGLPPIVVTPPTQTPDRPHRPRTRRRTQTARLKKKKTLTYLARRSPRTQERCATRQRDGRAAGKLPPSGTGSPHPQQCTRSQVRVCPVPAAHSERRAAAGAPLPPRRGTRSFTRVWLLRTATRSPSATAAAAREVPPRPPREKKTGNRAAEKLPQEGHPPPD
ncbi:hypothetical protein NDU88_000799 [Pleurodeles waltl]|uniref:Uncharacterized protein n=1 Tax=Pleurodeles waltl TaxID=8319 RepID=A0AAV7V7V5_PLEWA|nr:hypothetical protein NDU88_000799 [Pleurodeles waltl]